MRITNNYIHSSGHGPSGAQQERRCDTGTHFVGEWADGISFACSSSVVSGNTIQDATDGALVIFQSPGSTISNNTIISQDRVAMGGINLVDFNVSLFFGPTGISRTSS